MRSRKQKLAVFLSALLALQSQPFYAVQAAPGETAAVPKKITVQKATSQNAARTVTAQKSAADEVDEDGLLMDGEILEDATGSDAVLIEEVTPQKKSAKNVIAEISYNLGDSEVTVVDYDDTVSAEDMDELHFDEDKSFEITIPESNPFFPYEVQFATEDEVTEEWFMTPDDTVTVDGYTFSVSVEEDADGDPVYSSVTLSAGGKDITVYPEQKSFTDNASELEKANSLLPLEERTLSAIDMTELNPLELSYVKVSTIFRGEKVSGSQVAWRPLHEERAFKVSSIGDHVDLSYGCEDGETNWEMIVGDADQLNGDNIRYIVSIYVTPAEDFLVPELVSLTDAANRSYTMTEYRYMSYMDHETSETEHQVYGDATGSAAYDENEKVGIRLYLDDELYEDSQKMRDHIRVFGGRHEELSEALAAEDITDQIWKKISTDTPAGYSLRTSEESSGAYCYGTVTLVLYDDAGTAVSCMPVSLSFDIALHGAVTFRDMKDDTGRSVYYYTRRNDDGLKSDITIYVNKDHSVSGKYYLSLYYMDKEQQFSGEPVTAAYVGSYDSIAAAKAAGAKDIHTELFTGSGYQADYSKGVTFTIFVGDDGDGQEVFIFKAITEEYTESTNLRPDTAVRFRALKNTDGTTIESYYVEGNVKDSYGVFNYITFLAGDGTDLSAICPVFETVQGVTLYATGSKTAEVSGVSVHDFSSGAVQYTASSEDGQFSENYWVRVIKASTDNLIYLNSLNDPESETTVENGVIHTTREVILDSYHDYVHDIVLVNMNTSAMEKISVSLDSDVLELDDYWTLKGNQDLSGFTTLDTSGTNYGELSNLALLRLRRKDDVKNGAEISGTLTIKAGGKDLAVITLTGIVGSSAFLTDEIPDAVQYVPYGTMLQSTNKYKQNKPAFELRDGELPEGMEIRPNGEIYGVPKETGTFEFRVRMTNSFPYSSSTTRSFTLNVVENTDSNVDGSTDS